MVLLRQLLGDALRRLRLRQGRTLREVSAAARVSLGYLSEVERGQKEASSELLASICDALGAPLSHVLREVSDTFALAELQSEPMFSGVREPAAAGTRHPASVGIRQAATVGIREAAAIGAGAGARTANGSASGRVPVVPAAAAPAGDRHSGPSVTLSATAAKRLVMPAAGSVTDSSGQVLGRPALAALSEPAFEQVTRSALDITKMVPV